MAIYTLNQLRDMAKGKTAVEMKEIVLPMFTAHYKEVYKRDKERIEKKNPAGPFILSVTDHIDFDATTEAGFERSLKSLETFVARCKERISRIPHVSKVWVRMDESGLAVCYYHHVLLHKATIAAKASSWAEMYAWRLVHQPDDHHIEDDYKKITMYTK